MGRPPPTVRAPRDGTGRGPGPARGPCPDRGVHAAPPVPPASTVAVAATTVLRMVPPVCRFGGAPLRWVPPPGRRTRTRPARGSRSIPIERRAGTVRRRRDDSQYGDRAAAGDPVASGTARVSPLIRSGPPTAPVARDGRRWRSPSTVSTARRHHRAATASPRLRAARHQDRIMGVSSYGTKMAVTH